MIASFVRLVAGLLMMALPVVVGLYLHRTMNASWKVFRTGAVCFIASQIVHIPLLLVVINPILASFGIDDRNLKEMSVSKLAILSICLGLAAGVCEEVARWICYHKVLDREVINYRISVMLGAGHGGCEAFLTGLMAVLGLVQMIVLRSYVDPDQLPPDQKDMIEDQVTLYWSLPWFAVLMAPLERVFAMTLHVSLSVLVWRSFVSPSNTARWLGSSIAFHAVVDAVAVFAVTTWNIYVVECFLAVAVLPLSCWILYYFSKQEGNITVQFTAVSQSDSEEEGVDLGYSDCGEVDTGLE